MIRATVIVLLITLLVALLSGCGSGSGASPAALTSIGNGAIAVTANLSQFAGAVSSIVFNGRQFVNAHDHGRLFQTAVQVDGYGECHNPTEAGCAADFGKATSSSKLQAHAAEGDVLATEVQAASWGLAPDGLNFCPRGADPRLPAQPTKTIISKRVALGAIPGTAPAPNTIEWRVSVDCPDATQTLGIEILTGYLPASFTRAYTVSRKGKALVWIENWQSKLSPVDGYPDGATWVPVSTEDRAPIIWSTDDGQHALGVIRPASSVKKCEQWAYHLFRFDFGPDKGDGANSCVKFSVVTHAPVQCLGNKSDHVVWLLFGTLQEVHQQMSKFS